MGGLMTLVVVHLQGFCNMNGKSTPENLSTLTYGPCKLLQWQSKVFKGVGVYLCAHGLVGLQALLGDAERHWPVEGVHCATILIHCTTLTDLH